MNSFETDLRRAFFSKGFVLAVGCNLAILFLAGEDSDLYRVSVPVLGSFPYAGAWILERESGFYKLSLIRSGRFGYMLGKILACGISGGMVGLSGIAVYGKIRSENPAHPELIFAAGMLWAMVSAVLAAWTDSRYVAYGGSFVICYLLVILQERYMKAAYCINPNEWIQMKHEWIFGANGIVLFLSILMLSVICVYVLILERRMENG